MGMMMKSGRLVPLIALIAILTPACADPAAKSSRNREAEAAAVVEEVFRYEIAQFARKPSDSTPAALCLAIVESAGGPSIDPPAATFARFDSSRVVVPASRCPSGGAATLVAGPIEWVSSAEARVKLDFRSAASGAKSTTYRVVWEADAWHCVGSILTYDPL